LGQLNERLTYKVFVGDARTDSAVIEMTPLPLVELRLTAIPPKYARSVVEKLDASSRQFAILEGSSVELEIECTNRKRLQSAWLNVQEKDTARHLNLVPTDQNRLLWSLARETSPLKNVRGELRYEIQVLDEDGLSLQVPIRGTIRVRPDRPPSGIAEVIHKVVLPSAEPVVAYRASDDYGIARVALVVEVERGGAPKPASPMLVRGDDGAASSDATDSPPTTPPPPATAITPEIHHYEILRTGQATGEPARSASVTGNYALSLSPLKLMKGDRLKLTLEVTDYRGENDTAQPLGVADLSDPLVLEISDEAGVLAAISQADPHSEERLTEMIKRQLGIGESP
jgi:hypothetical protein